MAKKLVLLVFFVINCNHIFATEFQLFGGLEFGLGTFKVNNDLSFYDNGYYFINENVNTIFFAPGLSFGLRVMPDKEKNKFQTGYFFRDRAIFITNGKLIGTVSINDYTEKVSETYSVSDDESFTSIMDFDFGPSFRYIFSDKFLFLFDLGINFTIMDTEYNNTNEVFSYWGAGIYTALAIQVDFTNRLYMEFGLNSIINALSSQEGTFESPSSYRNISYKDAGRWDLTSTAIYIHIGWRFDLDELRK